MSAASLRFSWFISNSYSKSEIARRPLTIAVAPHSRANSTRRFEKTLTSMFSSPLWSRARSRNPLRSSGNPVDPQERLAVAALAPRLEGELEGIARRALGDDSAACAQARRQQLV